MYLQILFMIIITSCIFLQDDSIVVNRSFEVPNPVVENSIREEPIYDVPIDYNPVKEYQNVDNGSIRGKRKLVDLDGFSYTVRVWLQELFMHCYLHIISNVNSITQICWYWIEDLYLIYAIYVYVLLFAHYQSC